ncbi:TPA: shufflon system plasmid conjugative transfer pilus tip adhesin PilV [Klebsiella oxytoca]|nr:shufflon system plasmid conjugative transfer pilus tip adhesin PilV [Klebsiella oxytoca]
MKIKKGFSLLELTLVLGIGSMIAFLKFQDMRNEQETIIANAVGSQIKQLGEAVNRYISVRYDKLSTLSNAAGTGIDPGPRTCSGDGCEISFETLVNEGFLPVNYAGDNLQKSSYKILLKRDGTTPNYVINGLVATTAAWKDGSKIRYDLLGKAMMAAGIDSGMTKSATVASGYGGQWSEKSSDFKNITSEGLLVYRVGYDSSMYSVYLRRDGTLPMTGNLNMGGNDIDNAKNITATGKGRFGGNITSGGNIYAAHEVIAHNGYGDTITLGGDSAGEDYEIRLSNGARPLSIYSPHAANYTTVLNVWKNAKIQQRLATNGLDPNNLPSGWTGGIRTVDVYASGTVGTGDSSGNIKAYINASGNLYAAGTAQVDGDITSSGQIIANRRLTTNEFLQINGVAKEGASCATNGLQGRNASGLLLSCVSGIWQASIINGRNSNGYWQKNTSTGLITQWGRGNADGTKKFPVPFSDISSINLSVTNCADMGRYVDAAYGIINSISEFYTRTRQSADSNGYTSYPICWLAVGY